MRSLKTIEMAYSICADSLGNKSIYVYTDKDAVRVWCAEYSAKHDRVSQVIADTWRWALGDASRLPVAMVKSR